MPYVHLTGINSIKLHLRRERQALYTWEIATCCFFPYKAHPFRILPLNGNIVRILTHSGQPEFCLSSPQIKRFKVKVKVNLIVILQHHCCITKCGIPFHFMLHKKQKTYYLISWVQRIQWEHSQPEQRSWRYSSRFLSIFSHMARLC